MNPRIKYSVGFVCIAVILSSVVVADAQNRRNERWRDTPNRYWAQLENGDIIIGRDLREWHHERGNPRLDGKPMFNRDNFLRLLRDTTVQPRRYGAHVQFHNGDVLPGRVITARDSSVKADLPPHLVVAVTEPLIAHDRSPEIAIYPAAVARIVLQGHGKGPYEPGTLVFEDGRRVRINAVRWAPGGLRALTEDGFVSADWLEIAELHLPQKADDVIEAVTADLTAPCPTPDSRVGRIVTESAGVFTYRQSMVKIDSERDKFFGQYHAIQPAWSFDAIRVPIEYIVTRSYRNHDAIPLSSLPAKRLAQRSFTGADWPWRRNRNVRDGELACENMIADLGIGMHAYSELAFELPAHAKQFSAWVGIDNAVGGGGCVRCRVYLDSTDNKPVWQSDFLRGGAAPVKVGPLDIRDAKRLILVADYAHDKRPKGADPLDIRDEVSWLYPTITVDVQEMPASPRLKDLAQAVPQLADWRLGDVNKDQIVYRAYFHKERGRWAASMFLPADRQHETDDVLLELHRTIKVDETNALLHVEAGRGENNLEGHKLTVAVNGEKIGSFLNGDVTTNRAQGYMESRMYPLGAFAGQEIQLTLRVHPYRKGKYQPASLLWGRVNVRPVIEQLPESDKIIKPHVPLTKLKPQTVQIFPKDKSHGKALIAGRSTDDQPLHIRFFPISDGFAVPPGKSEITYQLDPAWKQFVAVIGMGDGTYGAGPFELKLDGEVVWQTKDPDRKKENDGTFGRTSPGQQVVLDIPPGSKTIMLRVAPGSRSFAVWGYAGFRTE